MANATNILPDSFLYQLPDLVRMDLPTLPPQTQNDFFTQYVQRKKSTGFAYLLWVFFGLHYAYVNRWGLQFLFWITAGGLGIWWLVDLFRMPGIVRRYNHKQALECLGSVRMMHGV
ncbi:TM2 domain-containing protein [Rufibacter latericius]|uniref:TM2 domain-containing protein n=1 Tax=Rufibacter latericius TaxID=2487040 RepID=A0A3M9MVN5_9BACT|nr:TM2 domain-containing protein [Rufibacter latericius]RNI29245.1 TM2 domain-containing protein [Rufibacter latericius]